MQHHTQRTVMSYAGASCWIQADVCNAAPHTAYTDELRGSILLDTKAGGTSSSISLVAKARGTSSSSLLATKAGGTSSSIRNI